jgi:hypothetical protein
MALKKGRGGARGGRKIGGETGGRDGGKGRGKGTVPAAPPTPAQIASAAAHAAEAARIAALPVLNIASPRPLTTREHDITDVYYYNEENFRRAIPDHESTLTAKAAAHRKDFRYDDQAGVVDEQRTKHPPADDPIERVTILVYNQKFQTLYSSESDEPHNENYVQENELRCPSAAEDPGIRKSTLMKCSSLAKELFTFEPDSRELELPIWWPRKHIHGEQIPSNRGYIIRHNCYLSWIDYNTVDTVIVPWLRNVEGWEDELVNLASSHAAAEKKRIDRDAAERAAGKDYGDAEGSEARPYIPRKETIPVPIVPSDLAGKINLYNVMLHLGVPKFIQKDTIEALVKQMHQRKLQDCELELVDITIGRFQSLSVGVLDPVINHLVGTYGFRDHTTDRELVNRICTREDPQNLEYGSQNAGRVEYDQDTVIVPPKLPVLAHNIRHWSGVRHRNGDARAAHVGYPLNVGKVLKYWRRSSTEPILARRPDTTESHRSKTNDGKMYGVEDLNYTEYSTYVLQNYKEYYTHIPGVPWTGDDGAAKPEGTLIQRNTPGRH